MPYLMYLLPLLAFLMAFWIWHPLRACSRRWLWAAVVLTAALGLSPMVLLMLMRGADVAYTTIARFQVAAGWLMGSLALAWVLALLRDGLRLGLWVLRAESALAVLRRPIFSVVVMAAGVGLSGWATLQGLAVPQVREQAIELPQLPQQLEGLRIAVLADIHASPINNAQHVQQIVQRANAAGADLIVLPGDLVDGDIASGRANIEPLAALRARLGVWASPGNHEYYSGYADWAAEFRRLGLTYLENQTAIVDVGGARLAISGVGDPAYAQANNRGAQGVAPDIPAVAQAARAARADFHVLLAHQPKLTPEAASMGDIDLQISGHTHGGHIWGMDRWVVAPANAGYVRGLYRVAPVGADPAITPNPQPLRLFVSSGAGLWAGFTLRLGVPSAIDVLVLRRADASAASH